MSALPYTQYTKTYKNGETAVIARAGPALDGVKVRIIGVIHDYYPVMMTYIAERLDGQLFDTNPRLFDNAPQGQFRAVMITSNCLDKIED